MQHHIRRYTRFKQTVERLSTRFDDINSDFASNIVRVMDTVQQSKPRPTSQALSEMSKRALKVPWDQFGIVRSKTNVSIFTETKSGTQAGTTA